MSAGVEDIEDMTVNPFIVPRFKEHQHLERAAHYPKIAVAYT